MSTTRVRALAAVAAALFVVACGGDEEASTTTAEPESDAPAGGEGSGASGSLVGTCPDTIVIQTDWYATPERAAAYGLIGAGGDIDASAGSYSGPLGDTGVDVEVRLGGPFIGFTPPAQQMYTDSSIYLAYVATDEAVQGATDFPTMAVVAPLDINPQILMWDPETYDVQGWEDIAATGATITYLEGLPFMDYLIDEGYVEESQLDSSFDGTPSRFVAEGGAVIQQGYASNEPYRWEHDVEGWLRPVDYLLVNDSGYEIYPQGLSVRTEDLEANADCLAELVPMIQQAQVDYATDPDEVNGLLVEIADAIGDGPPITADANADAAQVMLDEELISNGPDDTLGDFDLDRVDATIELLRPIFAARDTEVSAELTAEAIVTNQFIDPAIGL